MAKGTKAAEAERVAALRLELNRLARRYLDLPNIVGIGLDKKRSGGAIGTEDAVVFHVARKLGSSADIVLAGSATVPATVELLGRTYPTDVVEERWAPADAGGIATAVLRDRAGVIAPGLSVGGADGATGTIGAIVRDRETGRTCMLSNWHVLAVRGNGSVSQPGSEDDSRLEANAVGRVARSMMNRDGDAAIAFVEGRPVDGRIAGLGVAIERVADPVHEERVIKCGRTTGITRGRVNLLRTTAIFYYHKALPGTIIVEGFEIEPETGDTGQIEEKGDSGSAWMRCDASGRPTGTMVGLHFAQGPVGERALACYARRVFDRLKIDPMSSVGVIPQASAHSPQMGPQPVWPATAAGQVFRVVGSSVRVLRYPLANSPERSQRPVFGQLLRVLEWDGDWAIVDMDANGVADGYVYKGYLAAT